MADEDRIEIARWYTAGRRFPRLMGRLSDGTRIPGGPYTIQQLSVFVVGLIVLNQTRGLWGGFGALDYALLFALPWGAAKALGLFAWGRNPVTIVAGFMQLMSAPRFGRINGHAVTVEAPSGAPRTAGGYAFAGVRQVRAPQSDAVSAVARVDPVAAPAPELEAVPLSGVQQLLAGRTER